MGKGFPRWLRSFFFCYRGFRFFRYWDVVRCGRLELGIDVLRFLGMEFYGVCDPLLYQHGSLVVVKEIGKVFLLLLLVCLNVPGIIQYLALKVFHFQFLGRQLLLGFLFGNTFGYCDFLCHRVVC